MCANEPWRHRPDLPLGRAWSRPRISDSSRGWVKQTQVIRQLEREIGAYPPAARHWNRVVVLASVPLMDYLLMAPARLPPRRPA